MTEPDFDIGGVVLLLLCFYIYYVSMGRLYSVQAIRVFFMLRSLSLQLQGEPETQLPLTRPEDLIKTDDVLDLSKTQTEKHKCTQLDIKWCQITSYRPAEALTLAII